MPGRDDLARERRVAAHLFADEEEGRARAAPLQRAEHRRRAGRMGPVVEGQGHASSALDAPGDAQSGGQRRGVWGRRRGRPRRGGRAEREDGGTHGRMVAAMSASTAAGLAVAALAAACYETGYAFQALEARGVGARHALRVSLIGQLVRNVRWLGATALSLLGWPLQVLALSLAPAGARPADPGPRPAAAALPRRRVSSASPSGAASWSQSRSWSPGSRAWRSPRPTAARSPAGPG